jgi:hypothetical protein
MSVETHTVTIEVDSTDITDNVASWDINYPGIPAYCADFKCSIVSDTYWSLCDPATNFGTARVTITIDSEEHSFLLEDRGETLSPAEFNFDISGRSKQALLSSDYSDSLTDDENSTYLWSTTPSVLSALAEEAVTEGCPYTVNLNWNAYDTKLPPGLYSAKNQYPIQIIQRFSDSVGGWLNPQINGDLNIDEYSVDTVGESAIVSYTDTDDIVALSSGYFVGEGYDNVVIYGYGNSDETTGNNTTSPVISIKETFKSDPLTPYGAIIVRLYYYHPDLAYTNIAWDTTESMTIEYYNPGMGISQGTEEITEDIDYRFGEGRYTYTDVDGVSTSSLPTHNEDAIYKDSVTYDVNYIDIRISNFPDGNQLVVFYFDDLTGVSDYSFTVEGSAGSTASQTLILKDYFTDTLISGVSVYADASEPPTTSKGTTDGNGEITLTNLVIGTTYYVKFVKTGYQDSDEDILANDSFVAGS